MVSFALSRRARRQEIRFSRGIRTFNFVNSLSTICLVYLDKRLSEGCSLSYSKKQLCNVRVCARNSFSQPHLVKIVSFNIIFRSAKKLSQFRERNFSAFLLESCY